MSIPCEVVIARMQPQKQLRLPYLKTKTTTNLILNKGSSLTPTVAVFGLLLVLPLMPMHFLCHRGQMMHLILHTAYQNVKPIFQLIRPYYILKLEKQKTYRFFFDCTFLGSCFDGRSICSQFYLEDQPKGIRSSFFDITDVTKFFM